LINSVAGSTATGGDGGNRGTNGSAGGAGGAATAIGGGTPNNGASGT
jgi:hypothetical protein